MLGYTTARWAGLTLLISFLLSGCGRPHQPEQLLAQARQAHARGESRTAVIELKNLLQQQPNDAPARLLLGQVYLASGDPLSAEKELRRALALGMGPADVWPDLAQALLQQGQFDLAYQSLAGLSPDTQRPAADALAVLKGQALLGLKRDGDAGTAFEQVLARSPSHAGALAGLARLAVQQGRLDDGLALLDRALATHPGDIDSLHMKGDLLRMQGRNLQALPLYRQILALRPEHAQSHVDIASLQIQAGQYDAARAQLAAARKLAPASLMLAYTQALLDFRENKLKTAQEQLQLILRAAPEHMPATLLMGAVQRSLGDYPQAELTLRRFLDATPGHAYASRLLASVLLKNGDAQQAAALIAPFLAPPLLDATRQDVDMLALAGEIELRLRHYDKATDYFQQASALAPRQAMLHAALGMSRMGSGDNARAVAELEQAASLDGKSSRAATMLVLAELHNKHYDKALAAVNRMQQQQGEQAQMHNLKGGVLLLNGDRAGARASFERALALDPVFLPALDNLTQLDLADKHPELARKRLEAAQTRAPKDLGLTGALATLALSQGDAATARRWMEQAARENPDALAPAMQLAAFYGRHGDVPQALQLAEKLRANNPSNPDTLVLLAEVQGQAGKLDAVLDTLNKLAVLLPSSPELQLRVAGACLALRDQDGAQQALKKALALRPDFTQAQAALGSLLTARHAYGPALQLARAAQRAHPDGALGFKMEGDILMAQNQPAAALKSYQHGYDVQPSGAMMIPIHAALAMAGKPAEAGARLQAWLASHPAEIQVRSYFASSLLGQRDYPASSAQFDLIVKQQPDNVAALNNLAWLEQQQGSPRALELAERAYRLAGDDPAVIDTLGWILAQQGALARALPLLKKAAQLSPLPAAPAPATGAADIHFHYGATLAKAGNKREARQQLEPLQALPGSPLRQQVGDLLKQL